MFARVGIPLKNCAQVYRIPLEQIPLIKTGSVTSVPLIEKLLLSGDAGTVRDAGTDFPTRFPLVVFEKRWAAVDCGDA